MSKTVILIDGDVLAYRAAAIAEKREVEVLHKSSGKTKMFKTRTEFKEFLKGKEKEYIPEEWEFRDIQTPEDPAIAYSVMTRQIERFKSELFADACEVFISGKNNFRDSLKLPKKYKGNRDEMIRPVHLRNCKKFLVDNYDAWISNGFESDDYLVIRGYHYLNLGWNPIMITVDKDANAYSGLSVYDFTQDVPEIKLLPSFGSLWDTGKKITGNGFIFLCHQLLHGDPGDFYKPSELTSKKFGEKASYKLLKDCSTPKEALEVVVKTYKEWYPKDFTYESWDGDKIQGSWLQQLQLYYKCAKMKSSMEDNLDVEDLLKEYGVKYDENNE